MFSVLFAEDEKNLRTAVYDYLTSKGMHVVIAADGRDAAEKFYDNEFDLIVLDVMMPYVDGFEVCRLIRRKNKTIPIIFLTAMGEERDYLKGYNSGCDDYIVKPFPLSVLYEKCMNLTKRCKGIDKNNFLEICGVQVNFDTHQVLVEGTEIDLTSKDFQILQYLMENKNIVLSRELILTRVWGYDFYGDNRVVDTHIKSIRKALGEKASLIKTVINSGYSFQEVRYD